MPLPSSSCFSHNAKDMKIDDIYVFLLAQILNGLLDGSDWRLRQSLWGEYSEYIDQLAEYIFTCGDYEIQTSLVEALHRLKYFLLCELIVH